MTKASKRGRPRLLGETRDRGLLTVTKSVANEFKGFCILNEINPRKELESILKKWISSKKKKI